MKAVANAVLSKLRAMSGGGRKPPSVRTFEIVDAEPPVIYAIGDVHGRLDLLAALENVIIADAARHEGPKWIVALGDFIDRGPSSAQVLDHLLSRPPAGFERKCVAGNHEDLMLSFLRSPNVAATWLRVGGEDTLNSYGIGIRHCFQEGLSVRQWRSLIDSHVPPEHIEFLANLSSAIVTPNYAFVHDPLSYQVTGTDRPDMSSNADGPPRSRLIVHGHNPASMPMEVDGRINIDTGAYAGGCLTTVRLKNGKAAFFQVGGHQPPEDSTPRVSA